MSRLICYCFGYTEEDLYKDVLGRSSSIPGASDTGPSLACGHSSSIPGASDTGPSLACGPSLIMERILAEKKDGNCRCPETNPSGH
jgi:hypothetical protein